METCGCSLSDLRWLRERPWLYLRIELKQECPMLYSPSYTSGPLWLRTQIYRTGWGILPTCSRPSVVPSLPIRIWIRKQKKTNNTRTRSERLPEQFDCIFLYYLGGQLYSSSREYRLGFWAGMNLRFGSSRTHAQNQLTSAIPFPRSSYEGVNHSLSPQLERWDFCIVDASHRCW